MRRGMVVALAVALAVVVAIVAVVLWTRRGDDEAAPTPQLIGFSLDRTPVDGWRITSADVGLPDDVSIGKPFGSSGDRAYFLTECGSRCGGGFVYGIDLRTGARLFPPVLLDRPDDHTCHLNAPSAAICLSGKRVWVVDLEHGSVTHSGDTDLQEDGIAGPNVRPVGNPRGETRLVATVPGKGVYGLGAKAELTWFVPGSGQLVLSPPTVTDAAPLTLATQIPTPDDPHYRVFSVVDGTVKTPKPPDGATLRRAVAYPGGFAYQYETGNTAGVLFYNTAGRLQAQHQLKGYNLLDNTVAPIVLDQPIFRVYAPDGQQRLELPAADALYRAPQFRVVGNNLYVQSGQAWQQWNLQTGQAGATCPLDLTHFVGSDGRIVMSEEYHGYTRDIVAVDTANCQERWRITLDGRDDVVEQVGTSLIHRTAHELAALRQP
ncbi:MULTISPECIES: hypothetical protein [unclassified Mycolicibacterium]|uniref:hypothetical protein n=1 Tax=unclassified Mycolicibacterium TaxID=2636767 RepID=UPI002ED7A449